MVKPQKAADLIIVGGGLSGLLTAWLRLQAHPHETVMVIEAKDRIGGDHTWSFNKSDLDTAALEAVTAMIAHEWPSYEVRFPAYVRELSIPYATANSDSLRAAVAPWVSGGQLLIKTECSVVSAQAQTVHLRDGQVLTTRAVIDARGGINAERRLLAYQKFVGHTLNLSEPHGLSRPVLMDATVEQTDGYRFVYCLPFSATQLLLEDTYYANESSLEVSDIEARIQAYASAQGWVINDIQRREQGVLPITLAADSPSVSHSNVYAPRIGLAGGLFHATTGYSLPHAVRLAQRLSGLPNLGASTVRAIIDQYKSEHWRDEMFFRRLNRMLFHAGRPEVRYRILQRFYQLPEEVIARFYKCQLTTWDRGRILMGKPPVPVLKALAVWDEARFRAHYNHPEIEPKPSLQRK